VRVIDAGRQHLVPRRAAQGRRPIDPVFPRPWGEGLGEGIKLILHFVKPRDVEDAVPYRQPGVLRKDAVPYKFFIIYFAIRAGLEPAPTWFKYCARTHYLGTSRTPSPTWFKYCARAPSHKKYPLPTGEGRVRAIEFFEVEIL